MNSAGTFRQNVRVRSAATDGASGTGYSDGSSGTKSSTDAGADTASSTGPTAKSPFTDPSGDTCPDRSRLIARMQRMAFLLDSAITIPGTKVQIGLDPLIGFIPFVGDAISMLLSLYIVFLAWRIGAKRSILALMVLNVLVDFVMGLTPVLGDAADAVFKANLRNLKLLGLTQRW